MNAISPLTTAGGTIHGEIFSTKAIPSAPTALATRAYVDAVVATAPTLHAFAELEARIAELEARLRALTEVPPEVAPRLVVQERNIVVDPIVVTGPYFIQKPLSTLLAGAGMVAATGSAPPASPNPGTLWWDDVSGQLFVYYDDGTSSQWVQASHAP